MRAAQFAQAQAQQNQSNLMRNQRMNQVPGMNNEEPNGANLNAGKPGNLNMNRMHQMNAPNNNNAALNGQDGFQNMRSPAGSNNLNPNSQGPTSAPPPGSTPQPSVSPQNRAQSTNHNLGAQQSKNNHPPGANGKPQEKAPSHNATDANKGDADEMDQEFLGDDSFLGTDFDSSMMGDIDFEMFLNNPDDLGSLSGPSGNSQPPSGQGGNHSGNEGAGSMSDLFDTSFFNEGTTAE
ncbi:hypothetical protein K7432_014657 [Basidiobolus ranarum]|uniref:Uncharacterized protein n=1 Tax=Basidiobolus ranarum TaxID=34480 RepID=A0ABR2VP73_9FUNG